MVSGWFFSILFFFKGVDYRLLFIGYNHTGSGDRASNDREPSLATEAIGRVSLNSDSARKTTMQTQRRHTALVALAMVKGIVRSRADDLGKEVYGCCRKLVWV